MHFQQCITFKQEYEIIQKKDGRKRNIVIKGKKREGREIFPAEENAINRIVSNKSNSSKSVINV